MLFSLKKIWPPPSKESWQYKIYWNLFYIGGVLDIYLILYEFNLWTIPNEVRYYLGIPLILIGAFVVGFSIYSLGIKNTYGLENGFVDKKLYKFTRNPQYIGNVVLFVGLILFVNSLNLTVLFALTIIIFVTMPFSEEIWLEEKYGNQYIEYKNKTSRFL